MDSNQDRSKVTMYLVQSRGRTREWNVVLLAGLEGAAYEWFDKLRAQNISANEITYKMLIKAHSKGTKPKLANDMFLRAHEEGLSLAVKANDAVIQSSETVCASIDHSLMGPRPMEEEKGVRTQKFPGT
ncbi:hypothetical protein Droror1_Dr00012326 [Drosera rotundifolia]